MLYVYIMINNNDNEMKLTMTDVVAQKGEYILLGGEWNRDGSAAGRFSIGTEDEVGYPEIRATGTWSAVGFEDGEAIRAAVAEKLNMPLTQVGERID